MNRTLHRVRGASAIGARHPGEQGPYGADEDDLDDGQDQEPGVRATVGNPTDDEPHDH